MKILHVVSSMDPKMGGVCQAVRSIIEGSSTQTYNEVVTLDSSIEVFANDTFITHAMGPGKSPWLYSRKLIPWLKVNATRFDVIVVHGLWQFHTYAVQIAINYLRKANETANLRNNVSIPRFFVMPHGMLDPYFQKARGRKVKAVRNWFFWKIIEKNIVNSSYGLLFTCETEKLLARKNFSPYKPAREIVIGLGIEEVPEYNDNMRTLFLEKVPESLNTAYFLFLGRIHPKKGVDILIEAYISISLERSRLKMDTPLLVIAGPGRESSFGVEMLNLANKHSGVSKNILFPGMIEGESKWGALYGSDAFILPSHQENFGIAVAEALACSKPVLISDQVNIWREIKSAEGGLIKKDTLEGTVDLLETWLTLSADEKRLMGYNAFRCFEQSFEISPAARKFYQAISS